MFDGGKKVSTLGDKIPAGVVTGDQVQEIFAHAKANQYALPAANVVGSDSVNAVMETAREANAPVILQFSNGGAIFFAGKGLGNEDQKAAIAGAITGAHHVHREYRDLQAIPGTHEQNGDDPGD
jgi:fructose-bisphosphate aldolase class II